MPTLVLVCSLALAGCGGASASVPQTDRIEVGDALIDLVLSGSPSLPPESLRRWVAQSADAVATYCGRFPVPYVRLRIVFGGRGRIRRGTTYGGSRPLIRIGLDPRTSEADLRADWMLTHELVHLGFPEMDSAYSWIEEGLATYVEPIARARIGILTEEDVWHELATRLPQGLPQRGDGGLDGTESWGRTYWGGALFWLLADVEIREATSNRRGVQDALAGILASGGDIRVAWDLERTLRTGDQATGTRVLQNLHARLGTQAARIDLDALWKRLGVVRRASKVTLDDRAPLASIRESIISAARTRASRSHSLWLGLEEASPNSGWHCNGAMAVDAGFWGV